MKRILTVALALAMGSLAYAQTATPPAAVPAVPSNLKVVELVKEEALQVMNLQFSLILLQTNLESAVARRQDLTAKVEEKYKISFKDYSFDINTGYFVPRPKAEKAAVPTKPEDNKTPGDLKQVQATAEDALQIMNMEYAINGLENNGRQLFAKRQELIAKLEEKYKITMAAYDLDVVNGRFVERAAAAPDAAKPADPAKPAPAAAPKAK